MHEQPALDLFPPQKALLIPGRAVMATSPQAPDSWGSSSVRFMADADAGRGSSLPPLLQSTCAGPSQQKSTQSPSLDQ